MSTSNDFPLKPAVGDYVGFTNEQTMGTGLYFRSVLIQAFPLTADRGAMQALCDKVLNEPLGAPGRYTVQAPIAFLYFADVSMLMPLAEIERGVRWYSERLAGVWIPISIEGDAPDAPPAFFPCFEFAGTGLTRATIRETVGGPVELAEIRLPGDGPADPVRGVGPIRSPLGGSSFSVRCNVVDRYDRTRLTQRSELIRVAPLFDALDIYDASHGPFAAAAAAAASSEAPAAEPGGDALAAWFASHTSGGGTGAHKGQVRLVTLKQFRDARDGEKACYRAVVELTRTSSGLKAEPLPGKYLLTLKDVASHPIAAALGLDERRMQQGYMVRGIRAEVDFSTGLRAREIGPREASGAAGKQAAPRTGAAGDASGARVSISAPPPVASLPSYVTESQGDQVWKQPFVLRNARIYAFAVPADQKQLGALCDKVFNVPFDGAVHYEAPFAGAILYFVSIPDAFATGDKGARGMVSEIEAGLWIPLSQTRAKGGDRPHFAIFPRYTLLDADVAMSNGREIYGFYKELANIEYPADPTAFGFELNVMAVDRLEAGRIRKAEMQRLLSVTPIRGSKGGEAALARTVGGIIGKGTQWRSLLGLGVGGMRDLAKQVANLAPRFVFLKQFRHAANPDKACHQALVEADFKIEKIRRVEILEQEYELLLNEYASHPLPTELGLDPSARHIVGGFVMDLDFSFDNGRVLFERTARG